MAIKKREEIVEKQKLLLMCDFLLKGTRQGLLMQLILKTAKK